jgi:hypothetical protein
MSQRASGACGQCGVKIPGKLAWFPFRERKQVYPRISIEGDLEVSLAVLSAGILYWLASGVGLFLIGYVLVRWRKSARACYPMPFRRRKGYLSGLLFSLSLLVIPLSLRPDNCARCALAAAPALVTNLVSQ